MKRSSCRSGRRVVSVRRTTTRPRDRTLPAPIDQGGTGCNSSLRNHWRSPGQGNWRCRRRRAARSCRRRGRRGAGGGGCKAGAVASPAQNMGSDASSVLSVFRRSEITIGAPGTWLMYELAPHVKGFCDQSVRSSLGRNAWRFGGVSSPPKMSAPWVARAPMEKSTRRRHRRAVHRENRSETTSDRPRGSSSPTRARGIHPTACCRAAVTPAIPAPITMPSKDRPGMATL